MSQTRVQLVGNVGTGASFAGIVTATTFSGDGSGLTGVGIGTDDNINTTGIITASTINANEFVGTGDKLIFSPQPLSYSPGIGSTGISPVADIVITFNQQVTGGIGTVTLRTVSAGGTIAESFTVGSSSSITFSNNTVTLNPTGFLNSNTVYYPVFPQGTIQNYIGGNAETIDTYYFQTSAAPIATGFSPAVGVSTDVFSDNIVITYDQPIIAGSGTITLRTESRTGPIVQSFDVTTDVVISSNTLTINPTNDLLAGKIYYVVIPFGAITNNIGLSVVDGQLDYFFITQGASFAWGSNDFGQLAQNNVTQYSSPIQIPGTTWSSISGGTQHSLATKTDGTLWSWGLNNGGQLAQNNTTYYSSPVQIPGTTWSSISGGASHSLATKTDGTLWAWGINASGQLGQNNRTPYSSPVQIPGTTWSSIQKNNRANFSSATKTDGTLWAWGNNASGQLAQSNTTPYSSPVQIPGTTWSSISGDDNHLVVTKTDGTLWSWGQNANGRLGQNDTIQYSSPVQIPGTTWSSVSTGIDYSLATKTDNTLWSWGNNTFGQLGINATTSRSSPVQIPGTSWSFVLANETHSSALKGLLN